MLCFAELTNLNSCWKALAQENLSTYKKGYRFPPHHESMFFILRGRVRLVALTPDGEEKNLWYMREGCFFNETPAFFQGSPDAECSKAQMSYSVAECPKAQMTYSVFMTTSSFFHECTEDSLLGVTSFTRVKEIGMKHPDMLLNLCHSFSLKVTLLAQSMASFTLETPRQRVYKYLAARIEPGSNPPRIRRTMSYIEMANLLGMHRISLYKILNAAQKSGILAFDKKKTCITVLQPEIFFRNAGL